VITPARCVGVSWGFTIRGMVAALEPRDFPDVRIVQMTGSIGKPESESYATELCQKMARAFSCKLALLPAPGVVRNKQTREVYLSDEHVATTISLLPRITIAFVGIGSDLLLDRHARRKHPHPRRYARSRAHGRCGRYCAALH
jgi:DNA-binding transcriptional regulator LsrR (DeoR family)